MSESPTPNHTVGHSTSDIDELLCLLRTYEINAIADVRTLPASRRHPHFAREALSASLEKHGIAYRWFRELGGLRKPRPDSRHTALTHPSFRAYADHMETPQFDAAVRDLLAWAETRRVAILCAERLWWQCHRRLLADRLVTLGVPVIHILGPQRSEEHRASEFVRVDGEHLVYDALL
jgi:uncharacterized protein (DUF488 family)